MEASGEGDCGPCLGEEIDLLTVEASFACASTSLKSCLKKSFAGSAGFTGAVGNGAGSAGFTGAVGTKRLVKKIKFPKAMLLTTIHNYYLNAQEIEEYSRRNFETVVPHYSSAIGRQTMPSQDLDKRLFRLAVAQRNAVSFSKSAGTWRDGRGPKFPVLWDVDNQTVLGLPELYRGTEDMIDIKPVRRKWAKAIERLGSDWSSYEHVRMPSRNVKGWHPKSSKPDQLQDFISDPLSVSDLQRISNTVNVLAAGPHKPWSPVKRWLVDTGCGNDLISKAHVGDLETKQSKRPMLFHTANGDISALKELPLYIPQIKEHISPYVLDKTPSVLSVGARCVDMGWTFHWEGHSTRPYWIKPDGTIIYLHVDGFIPYLVVEDGFVCPVVAHPSGSVGYTDAAAGGASSGSTGAGIPSGSGAIRVDDETIKVGTITLREQAMSLEHMLLHVHNPYCKACAGAKSTHKPRRRRVKKAEGEALTTFGQSVTADHVYCASEEMQGFTGDKDIVIIHDIATKWTDAFPVRSKTADDATYAINEFRGREYLHHVYVDNSGELNKSIKGLGFPKGSSTPGIPQSNGIIENYVKLTLNGAKVILEQAGLPACFWPEAVRHYWCCRNTVVVDDNVPTPWEQRHGTHWLGQHVPFGARVRFKPSPLATRNAPKTSPDTRYGVFLGWMLQPGGHWKGDYRVVDLEDFAGMDLQVDALPAKCRVHVQKISVLKFDETEPVVFPLREKYEFTNGTLSGIEQALGSNVVNYDCPPIVDDVVPVVDQPPRPLPNIGGL